MILFVNYVIKYTGLCSIIVPPFQPRNIQHMPSYSSQFKKTEDEKVGKSKCKITILFVLAASGRIMKLRSLLYIFILLAQEIFTVSLFR